MKTRRFYINGDWVKPYGSDLQPIVNPATQKRIGKLAMGDKADVKRAVAAAKAAFPAWSGTSVGERLAYLTAIRDGLVARNADLAEAIMVEMGAPRSLAYDDQAPSGAGQFSEMIRVLKGFSFTEKRGSSLIVREAAGVCALITPWNWPLNQIACKVAPALAAGCTMVLKPSELAPLDAAIFAEVIDAAGLPPGVFNLVHGDGETVGRALVRHRDVDMISFTGSTRAGIDISRMAAKRVKRVALELGGKSPNIILPDADLAKAIDGSVRRVMENSGQSCNAPTRLLVPAERFDDAKQIAVAAAEQLTIGPPEENPDLGPIANKAQYKRVRAHIKDALEEGAELLTGGKVKPDGLHKGYFVAPTIFAVTPGMRIAREEVFGPVLVMMPYDDIDHAIVLANDTDYGLAAYVWSKSKAKARALAPHLRAGTVTINGASMDVKAPFGGMKLSGHGREWGREGLEEFLEVKSLYGGG